MRGINIFIASQIINRLKSLPSLVLFALWGVFDAVTAMRMPCTDLWRNSQAIFIIGATFLKVENPYGRDHKYCDSHVQDNAITYQPV